MAHLSSGEVVQRDLYSAFLLEYIDTESLEYNTKALNSAFPAFLVMHENTIKRLQKDKSYLPASVGFQNNSFSGNSTHSSLESCLARGETPQEDALKKLGTQKSMLVSLHGWTLIDNYTRSCW